MVPIQQRLGANEQVVLFQTGLGHPPSAEHCSAGAGKCCKEAGVRHLWKGGACCRAAGHPQQQEHRGAQARLGGLQDAAGALRLEPIADSATEVDRWLVGNKARLSRPGDLLSMRRTQESRLAHAVVGSKECPAQQRSVMPIRKSACPASLQSAARALL